MITQNLDDSISANYSCCSQRQSETMTYFPQFNKNSRQEDTSIEMKSLKSDQIKNSNYVNKLSKSSNFKIAMSCLVSAVGIVIFLICLVVANFGLSQQNAKYNVLVLGGLDIDGMYICVIIIQSAIAHTGSFLMSLTQNVAKNSSNFRFLRVILVLN